MSDALLERRISQAGTACRRAMNRRDFDRARLAWLWLVALVNGRSRQQVERMELARGLRA